MPVHVIVWGTMNPDGEATMNRDVTANREYHTADALGALSGLGLRFGFAGLQRILAADFAAAFTAVGAPATAVDCLTGRGEHVDDLLDAGFSRVIAVDLAEEEIEAGRRRFAGEARVEWVVEEIHAFFRGRPGPYDFIHLSSLHHIDAYTELVALAADVLRPGGALYLLERKRQGRLGTLLTKIDDHLYTFWDSPRLWVHRVLNRLGLGVGKTARAWQLAAEAEVHASTGLDPEAIVRTAEAHGCEVVFALGAYLPATRLFHCLLHPFGYRDQFRLLLRKKGGL